MAFLYIKVPISPESPLNEARLHEAIDAAMVADQLGTLIGWGASLGEPDAIGLRHEAFHRMDIEVRDPIDACQRLQEALLHIGAPAGTQIHYASGGLHLRLEHGAWS